MEGQSLLNHNDSFPYRQNYDPTIPPPPPPTPPRQSVSNTVTLGLGIVAAVMFGSLFFQGVNVAVTVISTTLFYGGILSLLVLIDTGYFNKRVESRTQIEIARIEYATQQIRVERAPQLTAYSQPVDPPLALPQPSSFVAPVADADDGVKREAMSWVIQLYGEDGKPDPKKVLLDDEENPGKLKERPGRLKIKAPSRPTKEYLVQHRVLLDIGGTGYRLNLGRCPNRIAAQEYLWRANGVSGRPTPHHLPTPTYSGVEVQP